MQRDVHCRKCNRYLFTAYGSVVLRIFCTNTSCKAHNDIKIISVDPAHDITFVFPDPPPDKVK